jgi:hypothetical protein
VCGRQTLLLWRVVKALGMVNSAEGFGDQPRVVNGFLI